MFISVQNSNSKGFVDMLKNEEVFLGALLYFNFQYQSVLNGVEKSLISLQSNIQLLQRTFYLGDDSQVF